MEKIKTIFLSKNGKLFMIERVLIVIVLSIAILLLISGVSLYNNAIYEEVMRNTLKCGY